MWSGFVQGGMSCTVGLLEPLHQANVGIWTEKTSEVEAKVDDMERTLEPFH